MESPQVPGDAQTPSGVGVPTPHQRGGEERSSRASRRGRFPHSVYGEGQEPDPRFSLANERTFLAWIRTSLALLAAAVALLAFDLPMRPALQLTGAGLFTLAALSGSVWAFWSWMTTERALRLSLPLPGLGVGAGISLLVMLAIIALVLGLATGDLDALFRR